MQKKVCSKCGNEKEITEFSKKKGGKFGVRSACKVCRKQDYQDNKEYYKQYYKQYYLDNKEKLHDQMKKWQKANTDKFRKYYQDNKEYYNEYQKQYSKERRRTDPFFKRLQNERTRLHEFLKGKDKSSGIVSLL